MPKGRFPILLLGPGRCGSTVLQEALNTSPRIAMWGEHSGFLRPMVQAYDAAVRCPAMGRLHYDQPVQTRAGKPLAQPESDQCLQWANPFCREDVREAFRRMIIELFARDLDRREVHFGFKEIRYLEPSGFQQFWKELFPDTRFLFLVREPVAVLASMYAAWRGPEAPDEPPESALGWIREQARYWNETVTSHLRWHEEPDTQSLIVRFEDLEVDPKRELQRIFDFVGLPMPETALLPFQELRGAMRGSAEHAKIRAALERHYALVEEDLSEGVHKLGYRAE